MRPGQPPQRQQGRGGYARPSSGLETIKAVMGSDFPYRRYLFGMADSGARLAKIVASPIGYERKQWRIPKDKIRARTPDFFERYYPLDLVVNRGEWKNDEVVDLYTEGSRVATPGYGESTSPVELYETHESDLAGRTRMSHNTSPEALRELIYDNVGEARLAYASLSRNLYAAIRDVFIAGEDGYQVRVVDISAYGDRAIAAASLGFKYVGIDPDSSLYSGYAALRRDLSMVVGIPSHSLEFNQMPLEAYVRSSEFGPADLFTVSPPPYDMEPYGGVGTRDPQTHATYVSMAAWARGFLFEIVHRARQIVRPDGRGVFAFTALDRTSGSQQIAYVEYLLLLAESVGFQYQGAIGLPSNVPWWIFKSPAYGEGSDRTDQARALLTQYYPELYNFVTGVSPLPVTPTNAPLLELVRESLQSFVIVALKSALRADVSVADIANNLGRWLTAVPRGSLDPVFPSSLTADQISGANEVLISALASKGETREVAEKAVLTHAYLLQSSDLLYAHQGVGVAGIYEACARFMRFVVNRTAFVRAANGITVTESGGRPMVVATQPGSVRFMRHEVPFGGRRDYFAEPGGHGVVLWRGKEPLPTRRFSDGHLWTQAERKQLALVSLRYESLGLVGHHFTRPMRRIQVLERAAGAPVIDVFANVFNANSPTFATLFPDVEAPLGALGNFFDMPLANRGGVSAYMANPPDTPAVLAAVSERLDSALRSSLDDKSSLVFFVGTSIWHDTNPDLVAAFAAKDPVRVETVLANSDNPLVSYIATRLRPFLVAAYRLDTSRYPTVLPNGETRTSRPGMSSVTLVVANPPRLADSSVLGTLGNMVTFEPASSKTLLPQAARKAKSRQSAAVPSEDVPVELARGATVTYPYRRFFLPPPKAMFAKLAELAASGDFGPDASPSGPGPRIVRTFPEDYEAMDGISNHFTEDVRAKARVGKESPYEVWESMRVPPVNYSENQELARQDQERLYEECQKRRSPEANIFNAAVAVYLYAWLIKDLAFPIDVVDPSAGWGDRLIAALACGEDRIKSYTGFDPNEELQPGYARIIAMLTGGTGGKASVAALPFEDAQLPEAAADLVMTSPPFYDLEIYVTPEDDKLGTQSTTRYKTWPEWLDGMYRPYLAGLYRCLKHGAYAVLYVSNYRKGRTLYPLANETTTEMEKLGAVLFDQGTVATGGPPRPFYVFRKPEPVPKPVPKQSRVSRRKTLVAVDAAGRQAETSGTAPASAVTIRPLTLADAEALAPVLAQPDNIGAAGRARPLESIRKMIDYFEKSNPGDEFFYALDLDGNVVGYVGLQRVTPEFKSSSTVLKTCGVKGIDRRDAMLQVYTSSAVRGSGAFRQVWPEIAGKMKASGIRSVYASTYIDNSLAQRAFAALGGVQVAECPPIGASTRSTMLIKIKL